MEIRCGIDVMELSRMQETLNRRPGLLKRIFSDAEVSYSQGFANPTPHLTARFCAKEAVMKLIGRGVGAVAFCDIEVTNAEFGRPEIELRGSALRYAQELGIGRIDLSLSHSTTVASAVAVAFATSGAGS